MKLWSYVTADGQFIMLHAPSRPVALRKLNLMLKATISPEDRALVEIPKTWMARLMSIHEDAVYDTMAADEVPVHYARRIANRWVRRTAFHWKDIVGERIYLDRRQADLFGVDYAKKGEVLYVAADTLLRSKDYDNHHKKVLKPVGGRTVHAIGTGNGWFEIQGVV